MVPTDSILAEGLPALFLFPHPKSWCLWADKHTGDLSLCFWVPITPGGERGNFRNFWLFLQVAFSFLLDGELWDQIFLLQNTGKLEG